MLLNVVLLWLLFAGTHVGLSITKLRSPLVAKLGEWGFVGVFSLVAISTYALLIHYFAIHRFDGPAGPNLAALPIVGWILYGVSSLGSRDTVSSRAYAFCRWHTRWRLPT